MHAYLIMAHNNFDQLKILANLLDDVKNDIYIHIDKKPDVDINALKNNLDVKRSSLFFINRNMVTWGGYSLVKTEYDLIEAAAKKHYDYYHLLSGVDLPIKSQLEIHEFFSKNNGKEFVQFGDKDWIDTVKGRIQYYWFFQERIGHSKKIGSIMLRGINQISVSIQKLVGINRLKQKEKMKIFSAGSNWFSITDEFAQYIVSQRELIQKTFKNCVCGDESFVQFMAVNSKFYNRCYHKEHDNQCTGNMRLIDWERGRSCIWRKENFEELRTSDMLFARKFDINTDAEIIKDVQELIMMYDSFPTQTKMNNTI